MPASVIDRWWPVTYDFGLVKAPVDVVLDKTQELWRQAGQEFSLIDLERPLEDCFRALEPLSSIPTKEMYLATRFGWTAFFRNAVRGSDPFLPMKLLSKALNTTAMRVCASPSKATYPSVIWEVYDTPEHGGNKWGYRRSIAAVNDGGSWVFETSGELYPFENTTYYSARRKRDRFTREVLFDYLTHFGIPPVVDAEFEIGGACKGGIIARPAHHHHPVYSLEDVTRA